MKLLHYFSYCSCFLLLFASPFGFFNAFQHYRSIIKTNDWPQTEGSIVKSEVKIVKDAGTSYLPDIHYTYKVDGKDYVSDQLIFGKSVQFGKLSLAEDYCKTYPINSNHKIFYNPLKPDESILESGVHIRHYFDFILPIFCFGLGIGLFYLLFLKDKKKEYQEADHED
jgi:hypothetical protein